jgi:hypothetical protein
MHNYTIRYFYFLIVLSLIVGCSINSKNEGNKLPEFYWQQSYLGGGGYITGLVQNPENPDLIFARCDVAGLFKSYDGGKKWNLVNKGLSHGYNHNTESVCISPHDTNIMFRASGEARNHTMVGEIHKSIDGGINWYSVTDEVDFLVTGLTVCMMKELLLTPLMPGLLLPVGTQKAFG